MKALYRTVQDVARLLQVHPRTVRRMIRGGRIPAVKIGREWRIPEGALEQWLGNGTRTGTDGRRPRSGESHGEAPLFMTAEEFLRLPEENLPVQLIKGYVVRDPAPFVPHQELVGRLYIVLHRNIVETGQGRVLLSPTDVVLSDDTVLQPDLLAVSNKRAHIIGRRVEGPPDLVIEVEAENTRERDLTVKRMLYAKHGVGEFWYVSGTRELVIQMCDPAGDDYRAKSIHKAPGQVISHVFPSMTVLLDELFPGT